MCRGRWLGVVVVVAACAGVSAADDPKPLMDTKAFDKLVVDTLRDVHDRGADLYNTKKDYAGAYRMYQGSLVTVRPLLAHRPDAQKIIDDGLAAAEKEADPATKAYTLHKTIEDVRASLRGVSPKPSDDKKPADKKSAETAPMPKVKPAVVSGVITFEGKPLADGEVTFVSRDDAKKVVTAKIKDGKYTVAEGLPPGEYKVTVSAKKDSKELLPMKYTSLDTTPLVATVKEGTNTIDIELTKK
ncbi:MAG TPA: carboxypeptidase-like regulatory domain-containing protein [Gemmataceae bacterium]|nr:carboxypeptidase-like regulatory domain-containing protein [Gemmataceae bacterium]